MPHVSVSCKLLLLSWRTNNPSTNQNNFFGLAIGLVIVAGGHAAGRVSGAVLNPAAAIGLEVGGAVGGSLKPYGLAYAFAELFGGIIAAAFFRIARLHEDHGTEASTVSRLFCEFFGTLLLCITIGLCLPQHSATPWAAGAALSAIVYAMHDVSGGHVNPAVTVAAVLSGKCPLERGWKTLNRSIGFGDFISTSFVVWPYQLTYVLGLSYT